MGWKKALFYGGAVLLLAACDRSATAPTSLVRVEGVQAAAKAKPAKPAALPTLGILAAPVGPSCSQVVIRTGDVPIEVCVPAGQ
jgi:hypothetical protein